MCCRHCSHSMPGCPRDPHGRGLGDDCDQAVVYSIVATRPWPDLLGSLDHSATATFPLPHDASEKASIVANGLLTRARVSCTPFVSALGGVLPDSQGVFSRYHDMGDVTSGSYRALSPATAPRLMHDVRRCGSPRGLSSPKDDLRPARRGRPWPAEPQGPGGSLRRRAVPRGNVAIASISRPRRARSHSPDGTSTAGQMQHRDC